MRKILGGCGKNPAFRGRRSRRAETVSARNPGGAPREIPDAFGKRAVVQIDFTDQPEGKRLWWYLNDEGRCQLCIDDPGGGVDLYLAATVVDMIRVYRGDISLGSALNDGRLEAIGDAAARVLADWLNLSPLSKVGPATPAAR